MTSSGGMRVRDCGFPGCGLRVLSPRIFCKRHWERLPGSFQQEIGKALMTSRTARLARWVDRALKYLEKTERG